eukprot:GABV01013286.1.p2 GENE.GABV01013286.1~~GABV01013286.1.p2  ORF type:complete len:112 (-),score=12.61 GABV01013286.1:11-346(-)
MGTVWQSGSLADAARWKKGKPRFESFNHVWKFIQYDTGDFQDPFFLVFVGENPQLPNHPLIAFIHKQPNPTQTHDVFLFGHWPTDDRGLPKPLRTSVVSWVQGARRCNEPH